MTVHFGRVPVFLISNPGTIREILSHRTDEFVSRDVVQNVRFLLGDTFRASNVFKSVIKACCGCMHEKAMLASDGPEHWEQRRGAHPGPSPSEIDRFVNVMQASAEKIGDTWHAQSQIDFVDAMQSLSLRIVTKALFDVDIDLPKLKEAFQCLTEYNVNPLKPLNKLHIDLPFLPYGKYKRAWSVIEAAIATVFAQSRSGKATTAIGLHNILHNEGDNPVFPRSRIQHYVFQMLGMGHATTASALTFALGLLALHKTETSEIREELFLELGTGPLTSENLARLNRLEMAILETLRLYPVIWAQARRAVKDVEVEQYYLPAGSFVFMSSWITHRNPELFPNADRFIPSRFSSAVNGGTRPKAFFPFGAGPHSCIGERFALLEMKVVLATLLRKYSFRAADNRLLRAKARTLILQPEAGLVLKVTPLGSEETGAGCAVPLEQSYSN